MKHPVLALAFGLFVGGCALDDVSTDEAPEGAAASDGIGAEFSQTDSYALTTQSGNNEQDLGTATGRTCFLSGITGHLNSMLFEIKISNVGGRYQLHVMTSAPVKVYSRCVNGPGTAEVPRNIASVGQVTIAPVAPGRRCFLTDLDFLDIHHFGETGFWEASSELEIANDGTSWFFPAVAPGQRLPANAKARCVDGTTNEGGFAAQAPAGGSSVVPLPWEAGTSCGLQKLKGAFTSDDLEDGVFIDRNNPPKDLQLIVTNGKYAKVGCVE